MRRHERDMRIHTGETILITGESIFLNNKKEFWNLLTNMLFGAEKGNPAEEWERKTTGLLEFSKGS